MGDLTTCPICSGAFGRCRTMPTNRDSYAFDCDGCGRFEISRTACVNWFRSPDRLSGAQRAALSHAFRTGSNSSKVLLIGNDWMDVFIQRARLPSPAEQATNLIIKIGDTIAEHGDGYFIDDVTDTPLIGAFNCSQFNNLVNELVERGQIKPLESVKRPNPRDVGVLQGSLYGLTLDGWKSYEEEKRGRFAGRYGFIAMRFNDPVLDPFIRDVVKPAIATGIGYDLVDLRAVARAGIIDNIMRAQIRDAAFILADLTHDNPGAYWEAGYAEGLGKPVIYLCERAKYDVAKTHFDTNHCTTVIWTSAGPHATFTEELVATLRRSLNLFADS